MVASRKHILSIKIKNDVGRFLFVFDLLFLDLRSVNQDFYSKQKERHSKGGRVPCS